MLLRSEAGMAVEGWPDGGRREARRGADTGSGGSVTQSPEPTDRGESSVLSILSQTSRRSRGGPETPGKSPGTRSGVPQSISSTPTRLHERRNRGCVAFVASVAAEKADADVGHVRRWRRGPWTIGIGFAHASPRERRVADLAQPHLIPSKRIRLTMPPWRQEERVPGQAAGACLAGLGRTSARRSSRPSRGRCGRLPRSRSCRSPSCP